MTLEQTKETLLVWVKSCQTKEQLELLEKVADDFISKRFHDVLPDVLVASVEISNAIEERLREIIITTVNR